MSKLSSSSQYQLFARFRKSTMARRCFWLLIFIIFLCWLGPLLSSFDFEFIDWEYMSMPPSVANQHYFGTDAMGRDLFVRTLQGGQISIAVGLVASLVSLLIGVTYGCLAGYFGGVLDQIMMRLVDVLYALPFLFIVLLIMVMFGSGMILVFAAIGAYIWLDMARIVRGQVLQLKQQEFVVAAVAMGAKPRQVILKHILPNLWPIVIVYLTLTIPQVILIEAFLSFLGLGVQEPFTSWGALVSEGAADMEMAPWSLMFPVLFLTVTLFCFYAVGDGLKDALDPKEVD